MGYRFARSNEIFPHLGSSANEEDIVLSDLTTKVDILETEFHSLTTQALERLQRDGVGLGTFYARVTSMKHTLKRIAGKYLKECFKQLGSSSSLEMLWGELNFFWDFFNYELFQHVVRVMFTEADDPLLSKLAEYEERIGRFLSSTKLCDFFKVWPFSIEKPQEKEIVELKKVVVKVDRKWEESTLHDVKNISSMFAQSFFLPREFLLLAGVGKSSVSLLWYIPSSVASSIEEKMKEKNTFLSDSGFLSLTIDGLQLYPLTPLRKCSLHLHQVYNLYHKKSILLPFKLAIITKKNVSRLSDKFSIATLRGDKDDIKYEKSPVSVSTLGTLPNGSLARLVLLEGAPGSGKTTFSFDSILKWTRKEFLTDITLLALFLLRDYDTKKVTNLKELLALITPDYEILFEELMTRKGEGMAFWFDGWDEIASGLGQSSVYKHLVSGEILPKARVIVTSRSWATSYLKAQLDKQPSQHVEITSSFQDQIEGLFQLKRTRSILQVRVDHRWVLKVPRKDSYYPWFHAYSLGH